METKFANQLHRTENDQDEAKVLELENTIAQHITAKEALQQEFDKMQRVFQEEKDQTAADVKKMSNDYATKQNELEEALSKIQTLQQTILQQKDVMASSGTAPSQNEENNTLQQEIGLLKKEMEALSSKYGVQEKALLQAKARVVELKSVVSRHEAAATTSLQDQHALKKRVGSTAAEDGGEFRAVDIESGLQSSNSGGNDKQRREISLMSEFKMAMGHLSPKLRQYTFVYIGIMHLLLLVLLFSQKGGGNSEVAHSGLHGA